MGGLKEQDDIIGDVNRLSDMGRGTIELDHIQALGELCRDQLEEMLKAHAIEMGVLKKEAVPRQGFNDPIEPERFAGPLHDGNWFDSGSGEATTQECLQPNPGFILGPQAQGQSGMVGLNIG
jgi:hypothetical protein